MQHAPFQDRISKPIFPRSNALIVGVQKIPRKWNITMFISQLVRAE